MPKKGKSRFTHKKRHIVKSYNNIPVQNMSIENSEDISHLCQQNVLVLEPSTSQDMHMSERIPWLKRTHDGKRMLMSQGAEQNDQRWVSNVRSMSWTSPEIIKLISLVRKRPCLYDTGHIEHNNREIVDSNWVLVADELGSKSAVDCKEKWAVLRGSYRRELKSVMSRTSMPGRKPQWFYFEMMSFMEPCVNINLNRSMYLSRRTNNVYQQNDIYNHHLANLSPYQHIKIETNDSMFANITNYTNQLESPKESSPLSMNENNTSISNDRLACENEFDSQGYQLKRHLSHMDDSEQTSNQKKTKTDPNMLFFQYICENMKKLSDKQQSDFLSKVLSTLNDILYTENGSAESK